MKQRAGCVRIALVPVLVIAVLVAAGCQTTGSNGSDRRARRGGKQSRIRRVICLFDQKPWINADAAGDRDPEGIRMRVFLDDGMGKGVLRDGTFHVKMYQVTRVAGESSQRTLASDWNYPPSRFPTVAARILGAGYHLHLRWADKEIAGCEIELITQFEDANGNKIRSATKRFRVPKYVS